MKTIRIHALLSTLVICLLATVSPARAQIDLLEENQSAGFLPPGGTSHPEHVSVTAVFTAPVAGQPGRLFVTAVIDPGWHIYSITQPPGGPKRSEITIESSESFRLLGQFQPSAQPERKREPIWDNLMIETHHGRVAWSAPIELASGVDPAALTIDGVLSTQACDPNSCIQHDLLFAASLAAVADLPAEAQSEASAAEGSPAKSLSAGALAAMLAGALAGGLILNLTPCVLPVISLKLFSFIQQGGESRARVFGLNLWYVAGLMAVFMVLASLSASFNLAWGEQFTLTWFKVALTALVFAMALSFLGVWEIPIPGFVGTGKAGELQSQEGPSGAFFKGVFTTILATPCIGPFLGPLFGLTLEQPAHISYLLFATVGLGMALPYLVVGAFPELIRFLPRPGGWMETLKEVMGFLLLATVVYLFTTLKETYFVPTLTLLVGLWFACWLIGRTPVTAEPGKKIGAWLGGTAVAALVGVFAFTVLLSELLLPWQTFSPEALRQGRDEGKTVMVDFTADWCPNCKYNLALAIDTKRVSRLVKQNGVLPLLADWTDKSPVIKEVLTSQLKRNAIPVLAIWPAGAADDGVIILDGTLTQGQVLEALESAGPSKPSG